MYSCCIPTFSCCSFCWNLFSPSSPASFPCTFRPCSIVAVSVLVMLGVPTEDLVCKAVSRLGAFPRPRECVVCLYGSQTETEQVSVIHWRPPCHKQTALVVPIEVSQLQGAVISQKASPSLLSRMWFLRFPGGAHGWTALFSCSLTVIRAARLPELLWSGLGS